MTEKLLSSYKLGNIELNNRAGLAPMTRTSASNEGIANERMAQYYANFANGGFGLVITEGTYTDELYSQGYHNQPGIANPTQGEAWKKVVEATHQEGSKIICQLMHAGALSQGNIYKQETLGPSATLPKGEQLAVYGGEGDYPIPREATKEDIADVIQGFVNSAIRAREAGFDGVEIHGANGYLLDQFLTDYSNQRTDEYGGSTETRVQLTVEVIDAVKKAVGNDFVVGVRVSLGKVNDYHHKWVRGEEDAKIIFEKIASAKPDYIHTTEYDATNPAFGEQGPSLAELARKYTGLPLIVNGNLEDPSKAEGIITSGHADIITLGKGALANPDWVKKVKEGKKIEEFTFDVLQPDATIKDKELLTSVTK
jgi:2,4-dienoyl-CoA reductase-like NADH-dependent reductase (Old Yellow Enzyme family)